MLGGFLLIGCYSRCPLLTLSRHEPLHCTRLLSGAKQTRPLATCPLSWSLLGVKRTWPIAPHMSANDPKRTQCLLLASSRQFLYRNTPPQSEKTYLPSD